MPKLMILWLLAVGCLSACEARADAQWTGAAGSPFVWSAPGNWDVGMVPASATERGTDDNNVARMPFNGTTTLIDATVNAVAFGVQIGHPIDGTLGSQSASNVLNMTGGTLTTQGNFLLNVGRGRNAIASHLVQLNLSGGVLDAAGITVPEAFDPDNVLGFTSVGLNAEMHVSGDAVVNTDLLRLGAADASSLVVLSDSAEMNLNDDNEGFATGALWIEAFEDPVRGSSLLDIRDDAVLTIHGEWWTDENGNGLRDTATAAELEYFEDNYIAKGWIVANGGADPVLATFAAGVITMRVPEPSQAASALALGGAFWILARRQAPGRRPSSRGAPRG